MQNTIFQSTRPVRGATVLDQRCVGCVAISIHAPRAGRDRSSLIFPQMMKNFNPRAPCGARLLPPYLSNQHRNFNPRAPCGARLAPVECITLSAGNAYFMLYIPLAQRNAIAHAITSNSTNYTEIYVALRNPPIPLSLHPIHDPQRDRRHRRHADNHEKHCPTGHRDAPPSRQKLGLACSVDLVL